MQNNIYINILIFFLTIIIFLRLIAIYVQLNLKIMIEFFRGILFKDTPKLRIEKTEDGQWMFTRKFKILYIGTKEMCKKYMKQQLSIT